MVVKAIKKSPTTIRVSRTDSRTRLAHFVVQKQHLLTLDLRLHRDDPLMPLMPFTLLMCASLYAFRALSCLSYTSSNADSEEWSLYSVWLSASSSTKLRCTRVECDEGLQREEEDRILLNKKGKVYFFPSV